MRALLALTVMIAALASPALADPQRVSFPAGKTGTKITATIIGDETLTYVLGARAGQRLQVEMTTSNPSAYFNVTAPGATEAMHIGSVVGNIYDGFLPAGGDYTVQVYLMRNAARRGEVAKLSISFKITGAGAANDPAPDFADGLMGGPDFWAVTGLKAGDTLNLRAGPSAREAVIARLSEGTVVRNLGCRMTGKQRWCQVEAAMGTGWLAGRYLRESAAPGSN